MQTSINAQLCAQSSNNAEFRIHCPIENPLFTPSFLVPPLYPLSSPVGNPLCHLSAPVIPCTYPLSFPASLCQPLYTHCHPKSSPVIPCTCLCHPCLPRHPLPGPWLLGDVLCSLYTITLAVTNHEN